MKIKYLGNFPILNKLSFRIAPIMCYYFKQKIRTAQVTQVPIFMMITEDYRFVLEEFFFNLRTKPEVYDYLPVSAESKVFCKSRRVNVRV